MGALYLAQASGAVSCIMAMQVDLCLSPCALSLLRKRQQLSTAMGCFYPASGSQRNPVN